MQFEGSDLVEQQNDHFSGIPKQHSSMTTFVKLNEAELL